MGRCLLENPTTWEDKPMRVLNITVPEKCDRGWFCRVYLDIPLGVEIIRAGFFSTKQELFDHLIKEYYYEYINCEN